MISTRVQLQYCQVLYVLFFFLSLYIVNVVSKDVYIILTEKKKVVRTKIKEEKLILNWFIVNFSKRGSW